jgi:hypothetical protein
VDLGALLIFALGEFSEHGSTRGPLFSWTLEDEIVNMS